MTPQEIADMAERINRATPEQIAQAMERLPTDALEWAVRFEGLGREDGENLRD
jgi:hypothetical protein